MITLKVGDSSSGNIHLWPGGYPPVPAVDAFFLSPFYNKKVKYGLDSRGRLICDNYSPAQYLHILESVWRAAIQRAKPGCTLWINLKPDDPFMVAKILETVQYAGWVLQHTFAWVYHSTRGPQPGALSFGHFNPTNGNNPHWGFECVYLFHRQEDKPYKLCRDAEGVAIPYADKSNLKRFTKRNGGLVKPDRRCRGNVWLIPYPTKNKKTHPCPFPTDLPEMALRLLALPPGSLIMDPFCGEGNTGVAAQKLGLDFWGIDLSPQFIEEARVKLLVPTTEKESIA